MSDETKYVCFKVGDWLEAWDDLQPGKTRDHITHPLSALQKKRIPDAVVIRHQDVFAPAALNSYANSIQAAIEVVQETGKGAPETVERLRRIADYFHTQAELAYERDDRKLPD